LFGVYARASSRIGFALLSLASVNGQCHSFSTPSPSHVMPSSFSSSMAAATTAASSSNRAADSTCKFHDVENVEGAIGGLLGGSPRGAWAARAGRRRATGRGCRAAR